MMNAECRMGRASLSLFCIHHSSFCIHPPQRPSDRGTVVKGIITAIVREGLLDEKGVQRLKDLVAQGRPLDDALREADGVPEDVLLRFLAREMMVPYLELEDVAPPKELLARF